MRRSQISPHPLYHLPPRKLPLLLFSNLSYSVNPHFPIISSSSSSPSITSPSSSPSSSSSSSAVVKNKRKRYRKACPGEGKGIVEEMRFVAMRLRNSSKNGNKDSPDADGDAVVEDTWRPSMEGFVKYLVDSRLVFQTLERIIDESSDISYTYFRKTGLERSASISKDLEWFQQQGIVIPQPSSPGATYAMYLEELGQKSAPAFLCHLYNIYFAQISGGQAIGKQVCQKLLLEKELQLYKWEGEVSELLCRAREKLDKLSEHWPREEKNRCLREAAKSFRFSGQIVRLIIL